MTPHPDRPRLRQGLAAARDAGNPGYVVLVDERRVTHRQLRISTHELVWAQLFDGKSELREIQQRAMQLVGNQLIEIDHFSRLVQKLDDAFFLESKRFYEYLTGPIREPSCVPVYGDTPDEIRKRLTDVFTAPGGPGMVQGPRPKESSLRGVLVPHMDFARGNITYGWGFRELFEKTAARLFIIIATSHYQTMPARYTLSGQHFQTPMGTVETDQSFIDRIVAHYGNDAFTDRLCHFPEHSIELEVVMLQFMYELHGPFRIVPMLVGSFGDAVFHGAQPHQYAEVSRMVEALQLAEAATDDEVCYIISGDLAHIGPKFDDPAPVYDEQLQQSRGQDEKLMKHAADIDIDGYFRVIAEEQDARRICGLPPTWTTLAAAKPSKGRLLHYQQFVHPQGYESVSFASMAFDK